MSGLDDVVRAALRASQERGVPVADLPVSVVATEAGISRSTLLRRLGGTRQALDEAVRAAGVDPGGQRPVRERAVEAAATLISAHGLAAATLERVATEAGCSVPSLYAVFGGRNELLFAVYERYSPVLDIESMLSGPQADLPETVRTVYRLTASALEREPRVLPAMLADALARPGDPLVQALHERYFPRMLDGVGRWLASEIEAGRIRGLPVVPLLQQMIGPLVFHLLLRPVAEPGGTDLPTTEETVEIFAEAFLRAVGCP